MNGLVECLIRNPVAAYSIPPSLSCYTFFKNRYVHPKRQKRNILTLVWQLEATGRKFCHTLIEIWKLKKRLQSNKCLPSTYLPTLLCVEEITTEVLCFFSNSEFIPHSSSLKITFSVWMKLLAFRINWFPVHLSLRNYVSVTYFY